MQQHLAYWVGIVAFALGGCAEGSQTFADDGGANTGNGPPTSSNGGNGGNGHGGAMTSSMGGDGPGPTTSTSTSTSTSTGGVMCGDDVCSGGEICSSCPADCGSCCPNGICDPGETTASCAADCPTTCPNGTCDATENQTTCPADCGSADCSHDPCSTGDALDPGECNGCAFLVCGSLPLCCILDWGSDCVAQAQGNPLCGC